MNRFEIAKGDDYFLISADEDQVQSKKEAYNVYDNVYQINGLTLNAITIEWNLSVEFYFWLDFSNANFGTLMVTTKILDICCAGKTLSYEFRFWHGFCIQWETDYLCKISRSEIIELYKCAILNFSLVIWTKNVTAKKMVDGQDGQASLQIAFS